MTTDQVIDYMTLRGWGLHESKPGTIESTKQQLTVAFYRDDWHGRRCEKRFYVTRYGRREDRDRLIRIAGRTAIVLWRRFENEPIRLNDPASHIVGWTDPSTLYEPPERLRRRGRSST